MSEDDKSDKIVFSTSKDLCATPAIDKSYLTEHYARIEKFNAVQKTRKEISKAERMAILQRSALDLRQDRAKEIKVPHTTIFEMVATFLNLDYQDVLDGALDSREHLDLIADLLKAGGRGAVVFMHSLLPPPLDFRLSESSVAEPTYQVVITDGSSYPLTDRAVLVYRIRRDINIDSNNVCEELFYTIIEPGLTKNVMESLEGPLSWSATEPALSTSNWGELTKTPSGMKSQKEFLVKFTSFNEFLTATKDDLLRKLVFEIPDGIIDKILSYPVEESITRSDPDFAKELLEVVKNWYKKIEKVLRSAQCVRKDIDDRGPRAESDYWRSLLTKFTSILEFSQLDEVQRILAALKSSRSFYILNWSPLINSIDAACNEASDNVRYLDDLNELSESLCTTPTPDLAELLRSMLYSIRLMFGCSRYFNTTERVTSLLIKVTNQVVMSFREYLTDSHSNTLWYIPKRTVISRIQICLKIYKNYRKFFSETQQAMADNPNENEFGCSEVNIFVRLSSFCSRLERVNDVFQTYIDYSILQSSCLDGVGKLTDELENNLKGFVSYSNDPLDEKTPDLLEPYTVFKEKMATFESNVRSFCSHLIDLCPTVLSSIAILERFKAMKLPCLCLDVEYLRLLEKFRNELDILRDRYNEEREENVSDVLGMAPFGGRIAWVRNLLHKIEHVMNTFKGRKFVINHERAQPVIRQYNCLCKVFLQNEIEHHGAWCEQLTDIHSLLEVPVFKRHNHAIKVNWSFYLREVIHEVETMLKMGLTVPDYLVIMQFCHLPLVQNRDQLNNLAQRYNALRRSIPQMYIAMLGPHLYRLDALMDLGHHEISWLSLDISAFCTQAGEEISKLEYFLQEISDLTNTRIVGSMKRLSETLLIDLSSNEPQYAQDLLTINEKRRKFLVQDFNTRVVAAENATIEIVQKFLDAYQVHSKLELNKKWLDNSKLFDDSEQLDDLTITDQLAFHRWHRPKEEDIGRLYDDCMHVYSGMFKKVVAALLSSIVASLEVLRSRFNDEEDKIPLFATDIVLTPPTVQLAPNLNEVQAAVMALTKDTLQILTELTMWGQRKEVTVLFREEGSEKIRPPSNLTSYFKLVYENKEVVRVVQSLQGCILLLKDDVSKVIGTYLEHKYLWEGGKFEEISRFLENEPDFFTLEDEVKRIVNFSQVITNLPHYHDVSCIRLNAAFLKNDLFKEAADWKKILGNILNAAYVKKIEKIKKFINDRQKVLHLHINDLDDVRLAMACLDLVQSTYIEMTENIDLIEDTFSLLSAKQFDMPSETVAAVDSLRYTYNIMYDEARVVQENLLRLQEPFKAELLSRLDQLRNDEEKYRIDYDAAGLSATGLPAKEANDRLTILMMKLDTLFERWQTISDGERLFGLPISDFPYFHEKKKEMQVLNRLYTLYDQVMRFNKKYQSILWSEINIEEMLSELNEFQNRYKRLPKTLMKFPAYAELVQSVDALKEMCPLLELVAHPSLKERHWLRLSEITSFTFPYESPQFCLRDVIQAPLLFHKEGVEDVCMGAQKELEVEAKLKNIVSEWQNVKLSFAPFKSRGELMLKGLETKEVITLLEDSLMICSSLFTNRYNAPFKKDIHIWLKKLSKSAETLENWLQVQNLWLYLEAVFVSGDIAKQLAQEAKRFSNIDKAWVRLMTRAKDVGTVVDVAGDEATFQMLGHLLEQLEACQKSLTGYLETLRGVFPRFYFVSDPTLLEILGQASDSHTIQNHLLNVFENVFRVEFDEKNYDSIIGMFSREMEHVKFDERVSASGSVEQWLHRLLTTALSSLNDVIASAVSKLFLPETKILDLLMDLPAQVGLLSIQFLWTRNSEMALRRSRVDRKIMRETNLSFLSMLNLLIEQTTKDLNKVERVKFETLITIHVHQRDIFDELTRRRIRSAVDFEWLKNMRFYWAEESQEARVSVTDVSFVYQNEFMGCTERLVITPLTDRCYITLAQAMGMSMGGAPAGPAGTGKTETVKDMAKALGKYCVVFNCSDQMDFRGLGRIYKGLAQSGSWGCFDEFNRIELPVLSVAAQQISIVLTARKERKATFIFSDGDKVPLNMEFGIFITMNPGYAGRQELPENLKMMFRPIAMMVPDRQIIMRVKLAACGFKENIELAKKFFTLYRLCEEQLSKQVHYDFGLRNILSVLRTLGAQKRANPNDSEKTTVMSVLRYMNVSKLVDEDEPLFTALVEDLFPGSRVKGSSQRELQRFVNEACNQLKLVNYPAWNLKIVQLYETSLVRHGLMLLGPTGAGKTTCTRALMLALSLSGTPHHEMRMNPKAITAPQMFGRLDVATNDWTDGIFSTLWRRTLKVDKSESTWLVLDGPVDAVWIENLNSVLDDNKTLTLANGDRITMAPNCKLLFEPDNVTNASPATVSRMGMVFISASVMPWQTVLKGWLMNRPNYDSAILQTIFSKIYQDLLEYFKTKLNPAMYAPDVIYIQQCCDLLDGFLMHAPAVNNISESHWEKMILFAMMWSVGSLLELPDRRRLENFALTHSSKLNWPRKNNEHSIFEYFVDELGNWQHWSTRIEEYLYPEDSVPEFLSILVPNIDNVRTVYLIQTIAKIGKSVLLIGEQGTAKTVMMKSYLSELDPEYNLNKTFNFSSATTPNMVQRIIESYVEKRVGTQFGPPGGKKLTVFIDDLSMPVVNEWGDQVTNELVRQLMQMGGFYSIDKPGDFLTIADMFIVAAMIHPGGGRNDIPDRLKRQFCIFNCTLPSDGSIDKIFAVIAEGYFSESRFNAEVAQVASQLVPLTRIVWQIVKSVMLPTPAKFHYVFNLRDLSRIWQGILTATFEGCRCSDDILQLWRHECQRVISDRLVTPEEQNWFSSCLTKECIKHIGPSAEILSEDRYFVDFLRDAPEPTGDEPDDAIIEAPKIYELLPSWDVLLVKLKEFMLTYNESVRGSKLDLVFFLDAMKHLLIISRVIRTPRGSMVLVGVGGSGKQSLTKLASHIADYKTFQISISRSYNVGNFLEDLKSLYRMSGQDGRGVTFLFTDNDVKDETFLEYLNNVLSAGEVANLFTKEEMEEISNNMIPIMKMQYPKRAPTLDALYDFFLTRSRANLHVILCFSPVGSKFRSRALKFPGLISGCTIDWFQKWPMDALHAVSNHILHAFPAICSDEVKEELITVMAEAHRTASDACTLYYNRFRRLNSVTPKSFLSLLGTYKEMYSNELAKINVLNARMATGVDKLNEAALGVDKLKKELEIKEKGIAVASAAANEVLAEVTTKAKATEKVKVELLAIKEKAEALVTDIAHETLTAESKLFAAKPALKAAEDALQTIKATDIATVRKLGNPPYLVRVIMDVVLILFQKKLSPVVFEEERNFMYTSWKESLKVLADPRFLQRLTSFPKDKINAETIDLMRPYLTNPEYTFEKAKSSSGNVAGLILWTRAMADFYHINKEVLPLKANLAILQKKLGVAQKQLSDAQIFLDEKQKELDEVQAVFNIAHGKQQVVLKDALACKLKMDTASALINGLTGERTRWSEQLLQFNAQSQRLVGDVALLASFLCYSGPFNQEFREMLRNQWTDNLQSRKIPASFDLVLTDVLVDSATVGEWNVFGLPSDELSLQNGILVTKAPRYPLLIDPQTQGKNWIKNMERNNELQVTGLNDRYFRNYLEDGVNLGKPLLIEDVEEELDPILDHVLEKNYIKIGTSLKVKVGDKEVDIHPHFRLYITTKLSNPAFSPEISAKTAVIDFTVTMKGLEEQLLGRVIVSEQNELEVERVNLIKGVTTNRREMEELETGLLQKLSTVEGSLVEDESLVKMLNTSKDTAAGIRLQLEVAQKTEEKLNTAREVFRPIATRGSILYFLVTDMALVNYMYQTSLAQFLERFDLSLERAEKHPIATRRIELIIDYLTFEIYGYQCRGLYSVNKFMFTLLMALKIDMQRKAVSYDDYLCLLKGGAALDLNNVPPKPCAWISDETWLNLVQLSNVRPFQHILDNVASAEKQWKLWFYKETPELELIPKPYQNLEVFKHFLLIRCWCIDRTMAAGRLYVGHALGPRFAEPIILNMEEMLRESRPTTPLLCLLSAGSDPTPQIERLAKSLTTECHAISMGQGQEIYARKLIERSMFDGGWVLLQNCHLGLEYMSELALCLNGTQTIHKNFRLFLTTEVHPSFPISLLQISIKYTNEVPMGIRAGLQRTYNDITEDTLELSDSPKYLPLFFTTSFFHSIVQERRKFGPLGWNIPYEFNNSDWTASVAFVRQHLDTMSKNGNISWQTIRYVIGEIQYGGRVTDDFDKRLLNTLVKHMFADDMMEPDFQLYQGYPVLSFKTVSEYLKALEAFPSTDAPQVCGLHANANIAFQTNEMRSMMITVMTIQPKQGDSGDLGSQEQRVRTQAEEMLQKLPPIYDPQDTRQRLQAMGLLSPMVIFLRQEIDRMQGVLKLVKQTLQDLLLAIEGSIIMNEALSSTMESINEARVPQHWLRKSWSSSTIGFWFTELLERNNQFSQWLIKGRPPYFWLTGFFNPQGFLTAMRQEITRANKGWALDSVALSNTVLRLTKETFSKPVQKGVVVYGLYLEGAAWDMRNSILMESPAKVLFVPMPLIHIDAVNSSDKKASNQDMYQCPVYKKPQRTDLTYITTLSLGTNRNPDHWIMRGVGLLCDVKP